MHDSLKAAVFVCALAAALAACSSPKATTQTPSPSPPAELPPGTINGTERLGWDQQAPDAEEFRDYSWALYVDGVPVVLTSATCGELAGDGPTASCLSPLPPLTLGQHTLELGTRFTRYGTVLESARSEALVVTVVRATAAALAGTAQRTLRLDRADERALSNADDPFVVEKVVDGLEHPAALARLPDGRLLIAERRGRVRMADAGVLLEAPAVELTDADPECELGWSLAVASDFAATRHVFVSYVARDTAGSRVGRVIRFRETGGILGEPAVVLDSLPAPAGVLRMKIGPDEALYVATGTDSQKDAEDLGSYAGKLLRFTVSGATPRDNPFGASPVFVAGLRGHHAFDWARSSGELWHLEEDADGVFLRRSRAAGESTVRITGGPIAGMVFHAGDSPAAWRQSLLLASPGDECLYRVSGLDASSPAPVVERLLANRVGRIVAVLSGKDGLYFAAVDGDAGAIYRVRDRDVR